MTIHRNATTDTAGLCYAEDPDHDEPAEADEKGACKTCGLRVFTDAMQAEVRELSRRWSALQSEIENEGFDRQARYEDGADSYDPYEDEDEETAKTLRAADDMRRELKERARRTELDTIEEMLAERGSRMMRPYEHWNEDERYMAWAEGEG